MGFESIVSSAAVVGTASTFIVVLYTTIRSWMLKFSAIERAARGSLQAAEELDLLRDEPGRLHETQSRNAQHGRLFGQRPTNTSKSAPHPPNSQPSGLRSDDNAQRRSRPRLPADPAAGLPEVPSWLREDPDLLHARAIDAAPGATTSRTPSVDALQAREYFAHIADAKRQSAIYFWTYLLSGVLGVSLLLTAAGLAAFGSRDIAIFTTICGALPTAISGLFYKRAGDVDKAARDNLALLDKAVENAKRMRSAREAASNLPPGPERDRILSMIAVRQLFPDAAPTDLAALLPQSNHNAEIADRSHPRDTETERS
ncbi:hypothetical protein [Nocardia sp. NPDC046763]|uniref:TRADD-N-associated membrane domain-containing protein n=1 Tax=Nocardia sp. NPDC046763 TaxID=3155256 RepID=UPI0033FBF4F6